VTKMAVKTEFKFKEEQVKTVDVHNMQTWEAKYYLERLLVDVEPEIKEVVVIHGYHRGTALMNVVRNELRSNKIKRRFQYLNQGITSLILAERT
jgi:hypothetical protein